MEMARVWRPRQSCKGDGLSDERNSYSTAFRELLRSNRGEPSWLTHQREDAFGYFERAGFPTVRQEDWKYTNVSPIARKDFSPVFGSAVGARQLNGNANTLFYDEARGSRLVFVNGILHQSLS